ncbi:MAG: outer membrane protein assembly factor BamE [Cypionkella sp.]
MTFGAGQVKEQNRRVLRALRTAATGRIASACGKTCAALAVVLVVACTPIYSNHGFIPDENDLADIKTGVDTRESVGGFLGRPSAEGVLGDGEWFYVQSRWRTYGGREPKEVNRQVLAISFDTAGKVSNVERFGLEKGEVVAISRRITTEPIKGRSALSQIFANFGRIDPSTLINR